MSDETLREAARLAAVSDDVQTRTRELAEQLRSGSRTVGDAELLAYVGDPVALLVLGEPAPELEGNDAALLWMRGFTAWGHDVQTRAVVAWLRAVFVAGPWGDPPARARFVEAVDRWWADPTVGPPTEVNWIWRLGNAASSLHRVVRAHATQQHEEVRVSIEHATWDESRPAMGFPSPALVAPQLSSWLGDSRPSFPAIGGAGPAWRRAVDAGTPPARRALVAYLRSYQDREQHAPVLLDGRPVELSVDHAGFEFVSGFINRSPMLRVRVDQLAIP